MTSSTSLGRLAIRTWAPCPAVPAAEVLRESCQLQDEVREACDETCGVIRLYVAPDLPSAEPEPRLAAS